MAKNKIYSISNDGLNVETKEKRKKEDTIALTESLKANKILTGVIKGSENIAEHGAAAILYYGDYKVIILANDLLEVTPVRGRPESEWPGYLVSKRLGSEIDYIVKGVDTENDVVVASRMDAMAKIRNERILPKDENGEYKLPVGSIAEARIVCSIRGGIYVEIFGVETFIPSRELSYQRVQDATIDFPVGEYILVKILDIKENEEGKLEISASVKQAQENPYIKAMERYNIGDKYIGEVSMVDEHGVFVALDGGVDALCQFPPRGPRPTKGTKVTIRITVKNKEMNRIFGSITHISTVM